MAISFSRPDPSSPTAVSTANFAHARRGYEPEEVREFLRMVAAELARLQEREKFLERELRVAQRHGPTSVALDEEVVTRMLGEEAARILSTAREAASQIKVRAEEGASRVLREATDEAQRLREEAEIESARRRQDAASDAESELQMAKQQGREMVNEARAYRERVLGELARRRELARQQIEQLVHGRDRLLQAFERARIAAVDVMAEMTPLGEPSEYVNLSPTTGPVPLMVPASDSRPQAVPDAEPEAPAHVLDTEMETAPAELAAIEADDEPPVDEFAVDEVDESLAPVVALFADDLDIVVAAEVEEAEEFEEEPSKVDDLFARLRAARAEPVVEPEITVEEIAVVDVTVVDVTVVDVTVVDVTVEEIAVVDVTVVDVTVVEATVEEITAEVSDPDATVALHLVRPASDTASEMVIGEELSVFSASPVAPEVEEDTDDSPFGRRDAELTPLIVAGARKLKRVLADEQNDVLHILRRTEAVLGLDAVLPTEAEHTLRYAAAVEGELRAAALAGAASVDSGDKGDHLHEINRGRALHPAIDALAATVVAPLRDRILRAVTDADGDNGDLADAVRAIYREWKTQRIDEHLDDVARMAFGRGALVALTPGTPVCWTVDPNGPACPDAEDNALAGVIGAGEAFPTDHTCAPAHDGCRCMLQRASR